MTSLSRLGPTHRCNSSQGILGQIKQILGHEYTHVRSLGVDELFVRKQRCPSASVPLQPPPYNRYPNFGLPVGPQPARAAAPAHPALVHRPTSGGIAHPNTHSLYNRTQVASKWGPQSSLVRRGSGPTHGDHGSMLDWMKARIGRMLAESSL